MDAYAPPTLTATNPANASLSWTIIITHDCHASANWYVDTFGFKLRHGGKTKTDWTELECGSPTLLAFHSASDGTTPTETPATKKGSPAAFAVPNMDAFHKFAVSKGVTFLKDPKVAWTSPNPANPTVQLQHIFAEILDPINNLQVTIMSSEPVAK